MAPNDYKAEGNTLTIKADGIVNKRNPRYGELEIFVVAEGYQPQVIKINVTKKTAEKPGQSQKPDEPKQPDNPKKPDTPKNPDNGGQNGNKPENGLKSLVKTGKKLHMGGDDGVLSIGSGFAVENAKEWLDSITAIAVDGVDYTNKGELGFFNKVEENQYGFALGILKIHRPNNKKQSVELVIKSSIYKSYTITFDNSSPYSADILKMEETNVASPSDNSGKQENELKSLDIPSYVELRNDKYFNVIHIGPDFGAKNAEDWIKNITSVEVNNVKFEKKVLDGFAKSVNANQYAFSSGKLLICLPFNDEKKASVIIEAEGYKTYKLTIDMSSMYEPKLIKIEEVN